jgi:hypothetical protein
MSRLRRLSHFIPRKHSSAKSPRERLLTCPGGGRRGGGLRKQVPVQVRQDLREQVRGQDGKEGRGCGTYIMCGCPTSIALSFSAIVASQSRNHLSTQHTLRRPPPLRPPWFVSHLRSIYPWPIPDKLTLFAHLYPTLTRLTSRPPSRPGTRCMGSVFTAGCLCCPASATCLSPSSSVREESALCVCDCLCVCVHVCMYVDMHACMYVFICVCVCVYICGFKRTKIRERARERERKRDLVSFNPRESPSHTTRHCSSLARGVHRSGCLASRRKLSGHRGSLQ